MSETSPLTAGGFAPPPIVPIAPEPDDDWLLQDFLAARALAPSLGTAARLDTFAAAHGDNEDDPSAADAPQAATPPNGGVVVRYRRALTADELAALSPGADPPQPAPASPPPTQEPAAGAAPPSRPPNSGSQALPPPAAPAPAFPASAPEPDVALDDWDTMPLGLKLQRVGEGLAPATPDTAPLSPLGRVLNALGQGAADGWGPEPLGLAPVTAQGLRQAGIFADPTTGRGGPVRFVNEALIRPAATLLDAAQRSGGALLFGGARALGQTYVEAGGSEAGGGALMRDIVALGTVASIAAGSAPGVGPRLTRGGATRATESAVSDVSRSLPHADLPPTSTVSEAAIPSTGAIEQTPSATSVPSTASGEGGAAERAAVTPRSGATTAEPAWKSNPYLAPETPLAGTRRTGIKRAEKLEVELVRRTGKGTLKEWTPQEIDEITRTGKIPDKIQGHHINSVVPYQEWAGDPRNIRFVRGQGGNLEEHGGNFRNPTTGLLIDRAAKIREAAGGR